MKKQLLSILALVLALSASAGVVEKFDFDGFTTHIYTSEEAMGDVSIVVEGAKSVVIFEPQSFYKSIEELNDYIATLGKPIEKVVANYHAGGLASYNPKQVVMVEPMVGFMKGEMAQGMMNRFSKMFQGAMDTRAVDVKRRFPATSTQKWAGVEFVFTAGSTSDFPASSANIGGKLYYTHFSPNREHPSPMQLNSINAVEATLAELRKAKESGCELFVGSHGGVADISDVEFLISYLETLATLRQRCNDSDSFTQQLITAYPALPEAQRVRKMANSLYPDEVACVEKEAVRARVQDYFAMVSNLDADIAKGLWAESDNVSIITPRSQFVGRDTIMNDFLLKTFSSMTYRKLSSLSEVVNIYGDSANVQLYWVFDTKDAKGVKHQTRGRETLIFAKIDGVWRLVHVHYSRMPQ